MTKSCALISSVFFSSVVNDLGCYFLQLGLAEFLGPQASESFAAAPAPAETVSSPPLSVPVTSEVRRLSRRVKLLVACTLYSVVLTIM